MNSEFVNQLTVAVGTGRSEMLEKDILLQQLLLDLSEDVFFYENFAFKGGTCLIKCYIGYYRFSEDIDFTWINQAKFNGISQKAIRAMLSEEVMKVCHIFERICAKRGLDFKFRKSDRRYVEMGGSNKMLTLKLWYDSVVLKRESFIKVQINFVEKMCFKIKAVMAEGMRVNSAKPGEISALFPEYKEYARGAKLNAYDIKEILSEKVRAILTRRGTKARDFVDIYMIWKKFGIMPADIHICIKDKIGLSLTLYGKYRSNFRANTERLQTEEFDAGKEANLLLLNMDNAEFTDFVEGLLNYLLKLSKEITVSQS